MIDEIKDNLYLTELKKFVNSNVVITTKDGRTHIGICKAINYQYLNVILMTETEKILFKDIADMRRKRSSIKEK